MKLKSESYNNLHSVAGDQRTRKNVRENLTFAMMLGIEEAREKGELHRIAGIDDATNLD